jgi:hypothetical protein
MMSGMNLFRVDLIRRYPVMGKVDLDAKIDEHKARVRFYELALEFAKAKDDIVALALAERASGKRLDNGEKVAFALYCALPIMSDDRIVAEVAGLIAAGVEPNRV